MRQDDVAGAVRSPARRRTAARPDADARFTHFDRDGNARDGRCLRQGRDRAHLAVARGGVLMAPETLALIREGGVKKGDVLSVARLAGIMAAKRTPDLIPLCHPLALTSVKVDLTLDRPQRAVDIDGDLQAQGPDRRRDGGADRRQRRRAHRLRHVQGRRPGMRITDIRLTHKSGGKSHLRGPTTAMISVEEALSAASPAPSRRWPPRPCLPSGLGRVLAEDVVARVASRRSRSRPWTATPCARRRRRDRAGRPAPWSARSPAGGGLRRPGRAGEAVRIFTGGPCPAGADTIVIQENTEPTATRSSSRRGRARALRPPGRASTSRPATWARRRTDAGGRREIGLAAAMNVPWLRSAAGRGRHPVDRRRGGDAGRAARARTRSSAPTASRWPPSSRPAGGEPVDLGIAADRPAPCAAGRRRRGADLLVTTGGASVGEHDLVQAALDERGLTLDFWKIAMRPGKPLMFGRFARHDMLGLPGTPSRLVCALLFCSREQRDVRPRRHGPAGPERNSRRPAARQRPAQDYCAPLWTEKTRRWLARPLEIRDSSMMATLTAMRTA